MALLILRAESLTQRAEISALFECKPTADGAAGKHMFATQPSAAIQTQREGE